MKIRLLVLILIISNICYSQGKKVEDYKLANIKNVIKLFKKGNSREIAKIIDFPLRREYPISSIRNADEFNLRFNEVFDKTLIENISKSKVKQWSEVGWRGIMLNNGVVWIDSDEGKITAINHQSECEKELKKELIEKDKENLHLSLKVFDSPTYKIKTKNYLIRIDRLSDYEYRYSSWKLGEKESSKPDIVLRSGKLEFQGSGGNHEITFSSGNHIYKVYRNIIGKDNSPDITLEVEKGGQVILTECGTLLE